MEEAIVYTIGERNIYLSGDINCKSTSDVIAKIVECTKNITESAKLIRDYNVGHINLFIQSSGGTVDDMWALIDIMLFNPIPIYTYAMGHAESAALKIFLAGSVRIMMPHAVLMYHELSYGAQGKATSLEEKQEYLLKEQEKIDEYVKSRTFMKMKQIKEIRQKKMDFYMNAKEAVDLGFATHIFECTDWNFILS